MENSQRRTDDGQNISFSPRLSRVVLNSGGHFPSRFQIFGQGKDGSNRMVLLCLGLLNAVLLIVAVVLGINCAKVREASLQVSHSAATELITELNYLRSNHSDVIEAEEEAKRALESALKNHARLKEKIEQQKIINDNYQRQIEALQTEKKNLQTNKTVLVGTCGRCPSRWILYNSSCYFFSSTESPAVKKNWPDSRADCISRGANLTVIDNKEEQKFVSATIGNLRGPQDSLENSFWIGLTDTETGGSWVWINNVTEAEPRYWKDGEPDNRGTLGDNCGAAVYSPSNPWKTRQDLGCHRDQTRWICEMISS